MHGQTLIFLLFKKPVYPNNIAYIKNVSATQCKSPGFLTLISCIGTEQNAFKVITEGTVIGHKGEK